MLNASTNLEPRYIGPHIDINRIPYPTPPSVPTPETSIEILNPKSMCSLEIQAVSDTLREMWSSENGLQELVQCLSCETISSKKDIFGHLEKDIYELTVGDIMKIHGMPYIPCPCCKEKTRFIYGESHDLAVSKRIQESEYINIMVAKYGEKIVGICMWYVPKSFDEIYDLEFKDHYSSIGVDKIKERVTMALDNGSNKMIMLAAIGFLDKYRNPFQLFEFLRLAFSAVPDEYKNLPGIMELDRNNTVMHSMFTKIGGKSLEFWKNEGSSISNTGKNYASDILVLKNTAETFHKNFGDLRVRRELLRNIAVSNRIPKVLH